jgi:hypothetical protein
VASAAVVLVLLLAIAVSGAAEDMPVPVETQLPLLLKVLTFDRHLQRTMGDELVIAVLYQERFRQSLLVKEGLEQAAAASELSLVAGTPFRLMPLALDGVDGSPDLIERLVAAEADVLYIAPLRAVALGQITVASRSLGLLTMTGVPAYVDDGITVAIEVVRSRPRIVINLDAAEAEGAELSSRLLNLARVVGHRAGS